MRFFRLQRFLLNKIPLHYRPYLVRSIYMKGPYIKEVGNFNLSLCVYGDVIGLEILFNFRIKINFLELFLIIKFYINNQSNVIHSVGIIASSQEKIPTLHNIFIPKLRDINHIDFEYWFNDLLQNDWQYLPHFKYYGFRIKFYKNSRVLDDMFPEYPWDENFLNTYAKNKKELSLELRLKGLRKNIKKLRKYADYRRLRS